MKPIVLAIFVLCSLNKCVTKSDCKDNTFLNEYTKGDFSSEIPPVNANLFFLTRLENNKILSTKNYMLYHVYKESFEKKYSSFSLFVCDIYSSKVVLKWEDFKSYNFENSEIIDLNGSIEEEYKSKGINEIINKYCIRSNTNFIIKTQPNSSITFSILYFLFINEYHITYTDYDGFFHFNNKLNN